MGQRQSPEEAPGAHDREAFEAAWRRWREEREAAVAAPDGFLAITGLHWLGPEPIRPAGAPGAWWSTEAEGVLVELAAGEELRVAGRRVTGRHAFGRIDAGSPLHAEYPGGVVELARRGERYLLRPRRPDHPPLLTYAGTPTHAPDPAWVLPGRFLPFAEPRPVTVDAVVPGLEHVFEAPGQVEFALAGDRRRLTAFNGRTAGTLLLLFADATSGVTTSGPGRTLALGPPAADGRLAVDLNRATNPPCAYTDHATCPLPPPENRLPVAVEAGELLPPRAAD
ncbi:DUF1684 domain-containing protein [Streptomyces sedi]|uniref:DUF1684 domain-containing protein n=1 Tax=Streptomyces sedi TaxID=555059 RepID=A0A5C4VCL1_9ACTN|nr:DUF1684 domain-containing protein [Streptomyces sedi]TNM33603.1 DUF1684 domain-containing protein [Streptomyces sedi]